MVHSELCAVSPLFLWITYCLCWDEMLTHRSALTISEREDSLCAFLSLGLVPVFSTAPGKAYGWNTEPRELLSYFKIFSLRTIGFILHFTNFSCKEKLFFLYTQRLEEMFANGRVQLVGTVKHLSFVRNTGLEDFGDLYQPIPRYGARTA